LPAIAVLSMSGSKAGSKRPKISIEDDALAKADLELRDLDAEVRPGERGVHAHHVAARPVSQPSYQTLSNWLERYEVAGR